jgi:hypothetical protein
LVELGKNKITAGFENRNSGKDAGFKIRCKRGLTQAENSSKLSARADGRGVRLPENLTATAYQRGNILPTFRQSGNDKKKKQ